MEKTYNKQNSFLKFHSLKKQNEKETLKYLKNILDDKSKLKSLNKYHLSIIDLVKKDLFTEKNTNFLYINKTTSASCSIAPLSRKSDITGL